MLRERQVFDIVDDFSGKTFVAGGWVLTAMNPHIKSNYHFEGLVNLHAALNYHGKAIFGLSSNMWLPSLSAHMRRLPDESPWSV